MQTVRANRQDFFHPECCPIALRTIQGDIPEQHEGDLTDICHTHDFSELIIITEGGGTHWIDGESYQVSAGDIFLIQGNTAHYFLKRSHLSMFNIMFDDSYLKEHLRSLRSLSGFNAFFLFEPSYRKSHKFRSRLHVTGETMCTLRQILQQMASGQNKNAPGADLLLLAKALEIFVFISREYSKNKDPMVRSLHRLGQLISRLESCYKEEWTIARMSRLVSMAPSTLIPVFKKVTGYSPVDYLIRVRLSKAAELLSREELSISDISRECGFADSNYFSRQFRCHYGVSPRDYRRH
ncbi:MAG: helix-turn-helix domain-containing protein [Lentisphaeria bacterium]|nr:helix-turn-helix domain-containing protein [Lentisphaeria bacterium]